MAENLLRNEKKYHIFPRKQTKIHLSGTHHLSSARKAIETTEKTCWLSAFPSHYKQYYSYASYEVQLLYPVYRTGIRVVKTVQ